MVPSYCFDRQWKSAEDCSWTHSDWRLWAISANLMSGLVRKDARTAEGLDRTTSSGMNDRSPMLVPSRAIAHVLQHRNDLNPDRWLSVDENSRFASLYALRAPCACNVTPALIETCATGYGNSIFPFSARLFQHFTSSPWIFTHFKYYLNIRNIISRSYLKSWISGISKLTSKAQFWELEKLYFINYNYKNMYWII